ncbi:unnamed protein product [Onchocerca ochengi]|uniref:Uncharacterized protein n=1 Tax=Onchocerca ochengi TaxID=42157 RepID=A0A182DXT6_ONCOC|nr:unnamed protein product [Onchocerca ochengi]
MTELPIVQCVSDTYQYINRIIEDALEQTEQILLKLKTRRDDTVINMKNKTARLSEIKGTKKKPSEMHKKPSEVHKKSSVVPLNKFGFSAERNPDDNGTGTLPASMPQHPRKISTSSRQITDLLHLPTDDEDRNLRFNDRIFIALDQKSIMLIREYDSFPNHDDQQQQPKSKDWYQQQAEAMDQHLQQVKKIGINRPAPSKNVRPEQFQQQTELSEMIQQQQLSRMQKPKINESGRFANKGEILLSNQNISISPFPTNALNAQDEFKSMSKEDDYCKKTTVSKKKVSEKLQKPKSYKERKKFDRRSKSYREKSSENFNSIRVAEQATSSEKTDSAWEARRSASDTSLQYSPIADKPDIISEEEDEVSVPEEGSDEIRQTGKYKKGRKKKKQQSVEQNFATKSVSKHPRSSVIDSMGHRKVSVVSKELN